MPASGGAVIRGGGRLLAASGVLSILGIAVAAYLTVVHYRADLLVCGAGGGCHTVQSSSYAVVAGIPIAILGLGMYISLLLLTCVRFKRAEWIAPATYAAFAIALAGVAYAIYLTYVELFVIDAICQWCVSSAVITTLICIVEGVAVWRLLDVEISEEE